MPGLLPFFRRDDDGREPSPTANLFHLVARDQRGLARSPTKWPGSCENTKRFSLDLVVAGAGVVAVPPIGAAGINGLLIQPATTTIAISIAVIARPPANPGYEDPIVEVIVEAVVDEVIVIEVIVIMTMPTSPTIPGGTRAPMPNAWTDT